MTAWECALPRRRFLRAGLALVGSGLFSICAVLPAEAPRTRKLPRIGYLGLSPSPAEEGFRLGLRELGYVEGETIVVEWRRAGGQEGRLPQLAEELLRHDLDVLVTRGTTETRVALQATSTLPVVFTNVTDPVGSGFVKNLARPEANATGISNSFPGLHGKRLELLSEAVPSVSRIAVLSYFNSAGSSAADHWQETDAAARKLRIEARLYDALAGTDLDSLFATIQHDRADGLILLPSGPVFHSQAPRFAELVARHHLPSMFEGRAFAAAGGLLAYGADLFDIPRRSATYVDRILKGAKPADLPVERPIKFDFVVNLKAAQALNLAMPTSILAQATEIVQ